jgi:hypothetical protein
LIFILVLEEKVTNKARKIRLRGGALKLLDQKRSKA